MDIGHSLRLSNLFSLEMEPTIAFPRMFRPTTITNAYNVQSTTVAPLRRCGAIAAQILSAMLVPKRRRRRRLPVRQPSLLRSTPYAARLHPSGADLLPSSRILSLIELFFHSCPGESLASCCKFAQLFVPTIEVFLSIKSCSRSFLIAQHPYVDSLMISGDFMCHETA